MTRKLLLRGCGIPTPRLQWKPIGFLAQSKEDNCSHPYGKTLLGTIGIHYWNSTIRKISSKFAHYWRWLLGIFTITDYWDSTIEDYWNSTIADYSDSTIEDYWDSNIADDSDSTIAEYWNPLFGIPVFNYSGITEIHYSGFQ